MIGAGCGKTRTALALIASAHTCRYLEPQAHDELFELFPAEETQAQSGRVNQFIYIRQNNNMVDEATRRFGERIEQYKQEYLVLENLKWHRTARKDCALEEVTPGQSTMHRAQFNDTDYARAFDLYKAWILPDITLLQQNDLYVGKNWGGCSRLVIIPEPF